MWRRALLRSSSALLRQGGTIGGGAPLCKVPLPRRPDLGARRWLGFANVWVEESVAAKQEREFKLGRREFYWRRRKERNESDAAVTASKRKRRRDLWRSKPGAEGRLAILDSGKILGRHRKVFIAKYGRPKRISKKARLAKVARRKIEKERLLNPTPKDTGAARRIRERRQDNLRLKSVRKLRDRNLPLEPSADNSSPFMVKKDERRIVKTSFGELDVTRARRLRDYKNKLKQLSASSAEVKKLDAGPQATIGKSSTPLLVDKPKTGSTQDTGAVRRLREKAEKELKKKQSASAGNSLALVDATLQAPKNVPEKPVAASKSSTKPLPKMERNGKERGLVNSSLTNKTRSKPARSDSHQNNGTAAKQSGQVPKKMEKKVEETVTSVSMSTSGDNNRSDTHQNNGIAAKQSGLAKKMEKKVEEAVASVSMSTSGDNNRPPFPSVSMLAPSDDECDTEWVCGAPSGGSRLAKELGTETLMDFPRLVKMKKKAVEKPGVTELNLESAAMDENKVLSLFKQAPSPFEDMAVNPLEEIEKRNISLKEKAKEKEIAEYEAMLRADLATYVPKKRINKRLIVHPDDTTFKRIDDERDPTSQPEPKPLGTNAKFRMIQPTFDLMNYIDSQMLGFRRLDEWRKAGYNLKLYAALDNVPYTKGDKRHKIQQNVFRNRHLFVAGAKTLTSIPPAELPEIAFAGRSNAGKSKLLNALTRHWGTARTSPRPGTTRSINFYVLGKELCMVDLPGYSFMYGKDEEIQNIRQLTKDYITLREELKRVCVLVDAQWGFKKVDQEFIDFLESIKQKYQIVLTKADKVSPRDLGRRATQINEIIKNSKSHVYPVMMVSARHGAGLGKLRMSLASVMD